MIEVKNLCKSFGDLQVLKGISETINDREVVCVIGHFRFRQEHIPALSESVRRTERWRSFSGWEEDQ